MELGNIRKTKLIPFFNDKGSYKEEDLQKESEKKRSLENKDFCILPQGQWN